jgi:hypothetical protein
MRFYTVEKLGPKQELTPEGFLLCRDVAIARTGTMLYAASEVPVEGGPDGIVRIERSPEEVFRDATIASFLGKPVTLNHPTEDVTPANWASLAKGTTYNVRRGVGLDDDFLIADLLITDGEAIQQVRDGLREVSCGYDAGYEQTEPGRGVQREIIGNHVALVEKGRCGSRCAIGDQIMAEKKKTCDKKQTWKDRILAAFKARDEAELETALEEALDEETVPNDPMAKFSADMARFSDGFTRVEDKLTTIDSRLTALETKDAKAKDEDEEEEKKKKDDESTNDSASLVTETQDVYARVEILSPGLPHPTHDAQATPAKVRDSLCDLRRKALERAYAEPKTRDAVAPFVAGKDLSKLTCDALHASFVGASELVKRENNSRSIIIHDSGKAAAAVANNIASINKANAEFWARK